MTGKRHVVISAPPLQESLLPKRWSGLLLAVGIAAVFLSVIVEAGFALKPYVDMPLRDMSADIDWHCLDTGLDEIHSLKDTARWWTGAWCGKIPYYRPLTSYVLWAERLLWPREYMLPREIILVVLHLCFVAISGLVLWRLMHRRWLTLLTVWLFAGYRPFPIGDVFGQVDSVQRILWDPKNVPDPLAGIAIMVGLLMLMDGKWLQALAAAVIGVGAKEIGFVAWPLAAVVLAWVYRDRVFAPGGLAYVIGSLRRNRLPVLAWSVALVLLLAIHFAAIGRGTLTRGPDHALPYRLALYFGGPITVSLVVRHLSPALMALLMYAALVVTRGRTLLPRFIAVLVALAGGVMLGARLQGVTWDASMATLLSWRLDVTIVLSCLIWLLVAETALRDRWTLVFGLAACAVASAPTWLCSFVLEHTRYIASFFMEITVAAALLVSARIICSRMLDRARVTNTRDRA